MDSKPVVINPQEGEWQQIELNDELIACYNLEKWAADFNLMTAGYRDQMDPNDAANPNVAINFVTIAMVGEAKARVFKRKGIKGQTLHVHIGGETRPHTQDFISILARIYAAHEFVVHLRQELNTTPIWYSSFGVFYEEMQSGDNLTASHSQFFKGGWKPMDALGKQLVEEEDAIIAEVKKMVSNNETIRLAPWTNDKILHDFDIDGAYINYQKSVVDERSLEEIKSAGKNGFRCAVCTVGGSMRFTTERLFKQIHIPTGEDGIIQYFFDQEDSQYHKIGQIDGENYGVDPTKEQIYRNIGAQERLLKGEANIVFIWDPDGDRFNMVTTAPAVKAEYYSQLGLEVELRDGNDRCIVYFTPNQIFFMLTAFRISALKKADLFDSHDWFIGLSVTTTRALNELAALENIPVVHVRVGFKHWGTFAEWLENPTNGDETYITALGDHVAIGKRPRLIIMCEESGGAIFGGIEPLTNRSASKKLIAMREKDGFQLGLLSLSLAAYLYNSNQSFADHYCDLVVNYKIKHKYFNRYDKLLYDEGLTGNERKEAKINGEVRRDKVMQFFRDLAVKYPAEMSFDSIREKINSKLAKGDKALPLLKQIRLVGEGGLLEGTYLEFDTFWFVIRASGTDAVLRYYFNGQDKNEIGIYKKSLMNLLI